MTDILEQRRGYRITQAVDGNLRTVELNRILAQIADRFDQLEGYRGTPTIKSDMDMTDHNINEIADGVEDTDAPSYGQIVDQSDRIDQNENDIAAIKVRMTAQETHGGISVNGNTSNLATAAQDTWYQYPYFNTNNASSGMTPDHTNNHITVGTTGTYLALFSASFSGSVSTDFEMQVFINNGDTGFNNAHFERKISASGDIGAAGGTGLISLTAGDTVELWVERTDGAGASKNFLGRDVTLTLVRVK